MGSAAESLADSLGTLLLRRFRAGVYDELVAGLHPALDAAGYPVISGVARLEPVRVATLGREIGLDRSIASRRSARLIEAGLLRSGPDPEQPRASLLSLTPEGGRVIAALRERLVARLADRLDGWPPADEDALATLLRRFVEEGPL